MGLISGPRIESEEKGGKYESGEYKFAARDRGRAKEYVRVSSFTLFNYVPNEAILAKKVAKLILHFLIIIPFH